MWACRMLEGPVLRPAAPRVPPTAPQHPPLHALPAQHPPLPRLFTPRCRCGNRRWRGCWGRAGRRRRRSAHACDGQAGGAVIEAGVVWPPPTCKDCKGCWQLVAGRGNRPGGIIRGQFNDSIVIGQLSEIPGGLIRPAKQLCGASLAGSRWRSRKRTPPSKLHVPSSPGRRPSGPRRRPRPRPCGTFYVAPLALLAALRVRCTMAAAPQPVEGAGSPEEAPPQPPQPDRSKSGGCLVCGTALRGPYEAVRIALPAGLRAAPAAAAAAAAVAAHMRPGLTSRGAMGCPPFPIQPNPI